MLPIGPYNPKVTEPEILDFWLKNKFYKPEFNPKFGLQKDIKTDIRKSYAIILPPPNANNTLHTGNISGNAYQDLFGRFARMQGKKTLLFAGKDHAGIQTEIVFEKELAKKNLSKKLLGREEFYKQCFEFSKAKSKEQDLAESKIGLSADFERSLFTLDPEVVEIVLSTFVKLFNDSMVYKGVRIGNWDAKAQTFLADLDTEREEREGTMYYIKYKVVDESEENYITVATTRPETMFGDTAVAVNPQDKRYSALVGKKVIIPLTTREIPIISSPRVEMEFGTGCLKITPAHSMDDWVIREEWNKQNPNNVIDVVNVIDKYLKFCGPVPEEYFGQKIYEYKEIIINRLQETGLLVKTEKTKQNVVIGERTKFMIEPILSSQWYVDTTKLKVEALKAVKEKRITVEPENMHKKLEAWLENLREWPISRSLWWGYRIPVWYKGQKSEEFDRDGHLVEKINGKMVDIKTSGDMLKVQIEKPVGDGWVQDEDVFDTWFSSGQWAYATLQAKNLVSEFYPTDLMLCGYDILELWVSRMIMLSLYRTGDIPFKKVYLTGLILGRDNQKMSKSKGNTVWPQELMDKYGTDAMRMFFYYGNKAGGMYAVSDEKLLMMKKFLNKYWNSAKFIEMQLVKVLDNKNVNEFCELTKNYKASMVFVDKDTRFNLQKYWEDLGQFQRDCVRKLENLKVGYVSEDLYNNFWNVFCDKVLEEAKPFLYGKSANGEVIEISADEQKMIVITLFKMFVTYTKLLHPFIPFITEKVYQEMIVLKNYTAEELKQCAVKSLMYEDIRT